MPDRKTIMISSTARDLPEHRKQVMDACLRERMPSRGYIFVHRLLQDYFAELWKREYAEAE